MPVFQTMADLFTPEIPFNPGFDLPSYSDVGSGLRRMMFSHPISDLSPPEIDSQFDSSLFVWEQLAVEDLGQ